MVVLHFTLIGYDNNNARNKSLRKYFYNCSKELYLLRVEREDFNENEENFKFNSCRYTST